MPWCGHPVTAATLSLARAPAFPSRPRPGWRRRRRRRRSQKYRFLPSFLRGGVEQSGVDDAVNGSGAAAGEVQIRCEGDVPDLEERDDNKVR